MAYGILGNSHNYKEKKTMANYLNKAEIENWLAITEAIRKLNAAMNEAQLAVMLSLNVSFETADDIALLKVNKRLQEAEEILSGLAYQCTPQPEWMGGDSQNPNNYKMRAPHIYNTPTLPECDLRLEL